MFYATFYLVVNNKLNYKQMCTLNDDVTPKMRKSVNQCQKLNFKNNLFYIYH